MSRRLHVSLYLDSQRDVLSIAFSRAQARGDDAPAESVRPPLQAVRMEQLAPHIVAKYDQLNNLVGLDFFHVSTLLGADDADLTLTVDAPSDGLRLPLPKDVLKSTELIFGKTKQPRGVGEAVPPAAEEKAPVPADGKPSPAKPGENSGPLPGDEGQGPGGEGQGTPGGVHKEVRPTGVPPVQLPVPAAARSLAPTGSAPASPGVFRWWRRWLAALRARLRGRRLCPHCHGDFTIKELAFKRFLRRKEAEKLARRTPLRSHFVYACPHCKGDIIDA